MKKSLVYTRTGDKGTTSLVGGTRVEKSHTRLDAYGTIDELNSFVGSLRCEIEEEEEQEMLMFIQNKLFVIGSYMATETESIAPKAASIITDDNIDRIERKMDEIDNNLPPIRQFILPGGSESASRAHICRTVARRAERCMHRVKKDYPVDDNIMKFVNRLSDYFFLLARKECNKKGTEIFWKQDTI